MVKRVFIVGVAFLLSVVAVEAKRSSRSDRKGEFPSSRMIEKLQLSDQQVKKMRKIDADFSAEKKQLDKKKMDRVQYRESIQKLRNKKDESLKSVLNDRQQETWKNMRKEARKERKATCVGCSAPKKDRKGRM